MARTVDAWVHKVGIGKIEWSRECVRKTKNVRVGNQFEWTEKLKLTARIGGHFVLYTRITPEEVQAMDFSQAQLDDLVASYVEFKMLAKTNDD